MIFIKYVAFALLALTGFPAFAENKSLRSRDLTTVCDTLKGCYLVNLKTKDETLLSGGEKYMLDDSNDRGYSIRCDVNGVGVSDFIKFSYDGVVQDEFGEPRWAFGDSGAGAYVNPVPYLATCGPKKVKVQGNIWANLCFEVDYYFEATCKGPTYAPVHAPVRAPVAPPTKTCPWGYTLINGCCVKDRPKCDKDFKCPSKSYRHPDRECCNSFDDCACNWGYYKKDKKCNKYFWWGDW